MNNTNTISVPKNYHWSFIQFYELPKLFQLRDFTDNIYPLLINLSDVNKS